MIHSVGHEKLLAGILLIGVASTPLLARAGPVWSPLQPSGRFLCMRDARAVTGSYSKACITGVGHVVLH